MTKKPAILIIIACLVIGFAIGLTASILISKIPEKSVLITEAELLEIHSDMFSMFAENFEWQLNSVEDRALADAERMGAYMSKNGAMTDVQLKRSLNPEFPYIEVYYALEADGKYVGTSDTADMSVDYRTRPWYVGAKFAGGAFITEPYDTVSDSSGEKIITFSYPIFGEDGEVIGVYGIDMNTSDLAARLLPRELAPYIKGILMITETGEVAPFFDYKNADSLSSAPLVTNITSGRHKFSIRIFGDFTEYDKTLGKMTFEEAKLLYEDTTTAQLLYQLKSSTDYIKSNVSRNSSIYSRIVAEITPELLHTMADGVNTEYWAYDDVYYVLEKDGKYIGIDETVSSEIDFRSRPWYIAAKESGDISRTDFYDSITGTRQEIMTFTAPLLNKNEEFVGAVGFDITTETAKSMLYNGDASLEILLSQIG